MLSTRTQPSWLLLVSSIGFLLLMKLIFSFAKWVYTSFLRKPKELKKYGSWALVTGATDGIGKAYAHQLASKGLNLVLVGRNSHKLEIVSNHIRSLFPNTMLKIVVLDFSTDHVESLEKEIKGIDVGVLINNVGTTHNASYFDEVEESVWMNVVRVNLEGTTRVTRSVLQGMIERKRGAIVNIASGAGVVVPSHPLHAIYASTKTYIDQLSRSLYVEYKTYGIDVQCQVPLYVATNMTSNVAAINKSSLFIPTPEDYAKAAIRFIGYEARCIPYWAHAVQCCFVTLLPESLLDEWRLSIGITRRNKERHPDTFSVKK
ncbi:hypothetical protein ACFE04_024422 [Oxalis oulophora]